VPSRPSTARRLGLERFDEGPGHRRARGEPRGDGGIETRGEERQYVRAHPIAHEAQVAIRTVLHPADLPSAEVGFDGCAGHLEEGRT
jgi:hypothetical protein